MTGIVTASWIALTTLGFAIRATPPSARMSAGTRSSAIAEPALDSECGALGHSPQYTGAVRAGWDSRVFRGCRDRAGPLLQLERPDPVLVGALVAGVHPIRKRLDQRQESGVGPGEGRAVR